MRRVPDVAGSGGVLDLERWRDGKANMFVDGSDVESQRRIGAIGVRIPAAVDQLLMLRAVAETVLLTADFTLDAVTDVRVALDEAATSLIVAAVEGQEVDCDFRYDTDQVEVRVASVTRTDEALRENTFSRQLLETLTDSLETVHHPFDRELGGYPVVVRFSRRRN